jgi:magnesium chelatase family protein
MDASLIRRHCQVDAEGEELLRAGMRQLGLSARAYHRVLKLARTIADMEPLDSITPAHLAEALQYRPRDPA